MYACCEDDISDVFGYFDAPRKYIPGAAPAEHIRPLARCLLKHGVVGALPPPKVRPEDAPPEYREDFDARGMVALAMAHLGLPEAEAWRMTMTSLVGAMRAKFPPA